MENFFVNHDTCIKCKLCINVCPVNLLHIDDNGFVDFIAEREEICLECGQCMAICSTKSVKVPTYDYEKDYEELPDTKIDFSSYSDFLSTRRSVRNFRKKQVERDIIEKILQVLQYAPYGAEPNKVEITVTNNRDKIEEALPLIEKFLDDIVGWVENPIISRIIRYKKGIETFNTLKNHLYPMSKLENYKLKYGDRISRGAPALMIFHADKASEEHTNNALIYATYIMLAIHALGLGASMNGIIPAAINKVTEIRNIFGIPHSHEAVISITLGYPKYKYKRVLRRKNKIVNWVV